MIQYPYTSLEIKAAKKRGKDTSKVSSNIEKREIVMPLSWSCTDVQCAKAIRDQNESKKVDVIVEATTGKHNITIDNPSTASKEEEKLKPVLAFWLVYLDIWSTKYTILINCGDEFHWVLAFVVLKERRIRVYDSMSRRILSRPSSEIQKLEKILPTYLDMSGFLNQNVCTDWPAIEVYRDKLGNPFDVQYVEGIAQQTIDSLDCGLFVAAYAEYLNDELQVPNDGIDVGLLHKRYAALLWKYKEEKAQKPYASDIIDPR
ncbi:hypothetical protein BC332_01199 [Capsicum chinense]|nr:hypothetical protein BC332_01199 [Capsicum chinense]